MGAPTNKETLQRPSIRITTMKDELIKALRSHAQGEINYHKANVAVYLANPCGIGEHSNVVGAITDELDQIAKYHDQLEVLDRYFK